MTEQSIPHGPIAVHLDKRCMEFRGDDVCAALKDHEGPHVWRSSDDVMVELPRLGP